MRTTRPSPEIPNALGAAAGVLADRLFGEPRFGPHPVQVLGDVMSAVERRLWRDERVPGIAHAAIGVGTGIAAGALARSTAITTWLTVSGRMLGETAMEIETALVTEGLDAARAALPALVGRDPAALDEAGVRRAVVESVAENTVDAVTAPALWAAALGARGTVAYRALNTLDSMVGHRTPRYERFGWASARLDDLAAWVPARVTALLVAAVRPHAAAAVWRAVRHQAPHHPSPNAGVAEAAFAAALGVQLGGITVYDTGVDHRPLLGEGREPDAGDVAAAVRLSRDVSFALAGVLGAVGVAGLLRRRR